MAWIHTWGGDHASEIRTVYHRVVPTAIETVGLVRHDKSTANVDPMVYKRQPDHTIPLFDPDSPSLYRAADVIRALGLVPERTCSWCSTYVRCRQSEETVLRHTFPGAVDRIRRRETFL